ncbi:hypothetical protein MA16_Dca010079 [Dendrobium catenatum]|uniref:Uncharacterized protein n=1 Tax=Dendrobium catenatum TaxID=906689 RepID=A0A2I0X712_9ASPA|nr:hypothetical protein MA16_Dca010079 [Dendrobium catenatum]
MLLTFKKRCKEREEVRGRRKWRGRKRRRRRKNKEEEKERVILAGERSLDSGRSRRLTTGSDRKMGKAPASAAARASKGGGRRRGFGLCWGVRKQGVKRSREGEGFGSSPGLCEHQ